VFSLELPGIERATEIPLTSGNAEIHDAKQCESTRDDLGSRSSRLRNQYKKFCLR
jgi:hypothetical protein